MSHGAPDLFGVPLKPDPSIALQPLSLQVTAKTGPLHKVQFVIEFVGPRSMPAAPVAQLLSPQWFQALGQPQIFVMRPSDLHWQRLTPSADGSYDSLSLAWDLITHQGELTSASARHLLSFGERFGPHIQRRAMPLPHPDDVDRTVAQLLEAREHLDIGFSLSVLVPRGVLERDLWIACARLGFDFAPGGTFDWRTRTHPYPLLSVSPMGETDTFSLRGVEAGLTHAGVTVGFSVPLCAAPAQALEACFYTAEHLAMEFGGDVLDQNDRRLNDRIKSELRELLRQALGMFADLGITTGSSEAIKLFGA